jgi:hypothetical protein
MLIQSQKSCLSIVLGATASSCEKTTSSNSHAFRFERSRAISSHIHVAVQKIPTIQFHHSKGAEAQHNSSSAVRFWLSLKAVPWRRVPRQCLHFTVKMQTLNTYFKRGRQTSSTSSARSHAPRANDRRTLGLGLQYLMASCVLVVACGWW